ncbi:MAG: hypothetical protein WKG01_04795 [Kofleriaceae bacterium]
MKDIELMQHVDGELDEREAAEERSRIERDADARTKVESLGQLTELVRGHLELSADAVPDRRFNSMWREIGQHLDGEAPAGLWASITAWLDRHRGHVITGAVTAGAVAAIALIVRPGDPGTTMMKQMGGLDVQPAALRSPPAIEALDTPDGTGTVINIEDEDGHAAVIWVTPADTVEGI